MELISNNIDKLRELSKRHFVKELYVFGSVVRGQLKKESDIDFLVQFEGVQLIDYFDNYMDLKKSLEKLFSRNVDLVEIQTLRNPILIKSIERDKKLIYGRKDSKMAV